MVLRNFKVNLTVLALVLFVVGCIPPKQVEDLKSKYSKCEEERDYLSGKNQELERALTESKSNASQLEREYKEMAKDTADYGKRIRKAIRDLEKQRAINNELKEIQTSRTSGAEAENKKLIAELQVKMEELQDKEDALKRLEQELNEKRKNLDLLNAELEKREARVKELEDLIAQKDAAVRALKDKIKAALSGFADKGIQVEQRNGRVYVSMEAQLLFASGSTSVGARGKEAIIQLAEALQEQTDLTILVEGHTDNDPIRSSFIKDNWDLSVMRATSVVRIMTENSSINPLILTAAGRGEYLPIAPNDNATNKAKNRRIEVILTPNLDKLFEILEEGSTTATQD